MSFFDCIDNAVKIGKIKPEKQAEIKAAYERAKKEAKAEGYDDFSAENVAAQKAIENVSSQTSAQKLARLRDIQTMYEIKQDFDRRTDLPPHEKLYLSLQRFQSRYQNRTAETRAMMGALVDEYRPKAAGLYRKSKGLNNIVDELGGKSTGDASAKEFAGIVKKVFDHLVNRANMLGANIAPNPRFLMPQQMARANLRGRKAEWMQDWLEHGDWEYMKWGEASGDRAGTKILPEEREEFLSHAFDTLDTGGSSKDSYNNIENIISRLSHERVLYAKSPESWRHINDKYGIGNPLEQIISHIDHMNRMIATLETMGRNPKSTSNYIAHLALREGAELQKAGNYIGQSPHDRVKAEIADFEDVFAAEIRGNITPEESLGVATLGTIKSTIGATGLSGSAAPSFFGNIRSAEIVAMLNGTLPGRYLKNFVAMMSKENRDVVAQMAAIAESELTRNIAQQRVFGVMEGFKWSKYINDVAMRATLVNFETQTARMAVATSMMQSWRNNMDVKFADLPFKEMLERNGITEKDWDFFRSNVKVHDPRGLNLISANDLRKLRSDQAHYVADKFMDMLFTERRRAVIEADARARNMFGALNHPGTFKGFVGSSASYAKTFSVALFYAGRNNLRGMKTAKTKTGYVAASALTALFTGALVLQLRQIKDGKDPMNMNDPKFWAAALIQGGALGFFGDYVYSSTNSYGTPLGAGIAGAPIQFVGDLLNLSVGNVAELYGGKKTHAGREAAQFAMRYLSPGSRFWPATLLFQRKIADALLEASDPNASERRRELEYKLFKDKGQRMWWGYGDSGPERAPDFSAMLRTK